MDIDSRGWTSPNYDRVKTAERDGLTDDRVTRTLEDREGNIRVATAGGLDCFQQPLASHPDGESGEQLQVGMNKRQSGLREAPTAGFRFMHSSAWWANR